MNEALSISSKGLLLIRKAEAFRANWYVCPAGEWTIGYGVTENALPGVNRSTVPGPISEPRAQVMLRRLVLRRYGAAVKQHVSVKLSQGQYDALCSFVYNIGEYAFKKSTLLRLLNKGDYVGAAGQFGRWVYSEGRKLGGLVKRRAAERALFEQEHGGTKTVEDVIAEVEAMPALSPRPIPSRRSLKALALARRL